MPEVGEPHPGGAKDLIAYIDDDICHTKVDWETHQILMKCRDKLNSVMAGPIPVIPGAHCASGGQADYKAD